MSADPADRAAFLRQADVSRETMDRLDIYADLLVRWNAKINLVGRATLSDLWTRHFLDSAQLLALAPSTARIWADLGAGAGFPGLVIAALAKGIGRDLAVTLIDSDQRKGVFLAQAAREMGLKVRIITDRIEQAEPVSADVVTARALAPLTKLLDYSQHHLGPGGICLFHKGTNLQEELTAARACWHIEAEEIPSITDQTGIVLRIGGFRHV